MRDLISFLIYCQLGRFQEEVKSWFGADQTCQEHDSHLVQIDSPEENDAVFVEIIGNGFQSRVTGAWLGLTQLETGNWTLMSSEGRGQAPSFANWGGAAPNQSSCATIITSRGQWAQWGAENCYIDDKNFLTICEKSPPVGTARNEGTCASVNYLSYDYVLPGQRVPKV